MASVTTTAGANPTNAPTNAPTKAPTTTSKVDLFGGATTTAPNCDCTCPKGDGGDSGVSHLSVSLLSVLGAIIFA